MFRRHQCFLFLCVFFCLLNIVKMKTNKFFQIIDVYATWNFYVFFSFFSLFFVLIVQYVFEHLFKVAIEKWTLFSKTFISLNRTTLFKTLQIYLTKMESKTFRFSSIFTMTISFLKITSYIACICEESKSGDNDWDVLTWWANHWYTWC